MSTPTPPWSATAGPAAPAEGRCRACVRRLCSMRCGVVWRSTWHHRPPSAAPGHRFEQLRPMLRMDVGEAQPDLDRQPGHHLVGLAAVDERRGQRQIGVGGTIRSEASGRCSNTPCSHDRRATAGQGWTGRSTSTTSSAPSPDRAPWVTLPRLGRGGAGCPTLRAGRPQWLGCCSRRSSRRASRDASCPIAARPEDGGCWRARTHASSSWSCSRSASATSPSPTSGRANRR